MATNRPPERVKMPRNPHEPGLWFALGARAGATLLAGAAAVVLAVALVEWAQVWIADVGLFVVLAGAALVLVGSAAVAWLAGVWLDT